MDWPLDVCLAGAAVLVVLGPDPAAEPAWLPWHPAAASPSTAQRASLLKVCRTLVTTR
jgi:hypothetical protein